MSSNRRLVTGIIVIAVLCIAAVSVLIFFSPSSSTSLHYERGYTGTKPVYLSMAGLEDCVLTMGYEDDESLMYRIDIELYEAGEPMYLEYREGSFEHFIEMNWEAHYGTVTRARYVNITLGTGHPYEITLGDSRSSNVTGNIVFDNNATLGNMTFAYIFPGAVSLVFTEHVDYSLGGLEMQIGPSSNTEVETVNMYIDLPDEMDGYGMFRSESTSISATGWTLYKQTVSPTTKYYRTSADPVKPLLDISGVYASTIISTLLN